MSFEFRQLIDNQDPEALRTFIAANEALNYASVSPNGASALWWALMPPKGKSISHEVVTCLLNYIKTDGTPLIDPTQSLAGLTPRQYLEALSDSHLGELNGVLHAVTVAENRYQRQPQRQAGLAALANDAQNAHDSTISQLASSNTIRLYEHYIEGDSSTTLDEALCQQAFIEITTFIKGHPRITAVRAGQMQQGLDYCFASNAQFSFRNGRDDEGDEFTLSLAQLTSLIWLAAKESDESLLPEDGDDVDGLLRLEARKTALLNALYDNATAYGQGNPSCAGGACNRLGSALASLHNLVRAFPEGAKLEGEMASMVITRVLGEALDNLSQAKPQAHLATVRCFSLEAYDQEDEDKALYDAFITEQRGSLESALIDENIKEELIADTMATISGDYATYPLSSHKPSYQLSVLMETFATQGFDTRLFFTEKPTLEMVNQAMERLASLLIEKEPFSELVRTHGYDLCDENKVAFAKQFISTWLEHTKPGDGVINIGDFVDNKLREEQLFFPEQCFYLAFFESQKEVLVQANPHQALWLRQLTNQQIIALMSAVAQQYPGQIGTPDFALLSSLIDQALVQGVTANISLKGVRFKERDLRGHDFSGVNLDGVHFIDCLLPTNGNPASLEGIVLEGCQLPLITSHAPARDIAPFLRYAPLPKLTLALYLHKVQSVRDLSARIGYKGTALIWAEKIGDNAAVSAILNNPYCNSEVLKAKGCFDDTALTSAAKNGNADIANAILNSPYCNGDLLKARDINGYTALMWAAKNGNTEIVNAILNNQYCNSEFLKAKGSLGVTALIAAAESGNAETVKAILDNPYCDSEFFKAQEDDGTTALIAAAESGNTETVNAILNNRYCNSEVLKAKGSLGDTALMRAAGRGNTETVKAILDSPYCDRSFLDTKNKSGKTAFNLAISNGYTEIAQAIALAKSRHPLFKGDISMMVLGGFIAAVGISAVALAFTVLSAATLGAAGIALATAGVAASLSGVGLFSAGFIKRRPEQSTHVSETMPEPQATPTVFN